MKQLELLNRKSKGIDEIHPLKAQSFERQREVLLRIEQQVRDFQLGYPVFDLLRMNDFWTEVHVVLQDFDRVE